MNVRSIIKKKNHEKGNCCAGDCVLSSMAAQAQTGGGMTGEQKEQAVKTVKLRTVSVAGITAIYAVCFALIKSGLAFAPPLRFAGLRALIGGTALLGFDAAAGRPLLPVLRSLPWLLALAVTTTVGFGAMFLSPGRTGAGIASVLGNTQPLFAVLLAALFLRERITRGKGASLVLGSTGVALISYPALAGPEAHGVSGPALALAVSVAAAAGSVIIKRMGRQHDLLTMTAWQLIIGSLPLLSASAITERGATITWNTEFTALLLFLALFGTSLATFAWYRLIQREEVGRLSLFLFLVPLFGLAIGAFILRETISPLEVAGAVLTIAGVGAMMREQET